MTWLRPVSRFGGTGRKGGGANELGPGLSRRQRVKVEDNSGWSGAGAESVACGHWREPVPGVLLEALNDGIEPNRSINLLQCSMPESNSRSHCLYFKYHARCQYLPDDSQSRATGAATPCPMCRVCKSVKVHATPAATFGLPPVPSPSQASTRPSCLVLPNSRASTGQQMRALRQPAMRGSLPDGYFGLAMSARLTLAFRKCL